MSQNYKLNDVFGNWRDSDSPTYVERRRFDARFRDYLTGFDDIIVHGGSRQGKTMLRKRNLPDDQCIAINCAQGMSEADILDKAVRLAGVDFDITEIRTRRSRGRNTNVSAEGGIGTPFGSMGASGEAENSQSHNVEYNRSTVSDHDTVYYLMELLSDELGDTRKWLVLDDFHFLERSVQAQLAGHLKTLQEDGVFAVILGVWQEPNLLQQDSGQLRTVDINIDWSTEELQEVLELGCKALKIHLTPDIAREVIADASRSISLLQNLMKQLCWEANVLETNQRRTTISDIEILNRARIELCEAKLGAYKQFFRRIVQNVRTRENSLRMYERIMQVCVTTASDEQLIQGISPSLLREWIQPIEPRVRPSDVTQALQRINGLQDEREISDIVFYFDDHQLKLVDRDLLFYRRYNNSPYPWQQEENDD